MKPAFTALLASALLASPAPAGEAADVMRALDGQWRAGGNAMSPEAIANMRWRPVLGGKFYRLDYAFDTAPEGRGFRFDGTAYYRNEEGDAAAGFWIDSTGALHRLRAVAARSVLSVHWGSAETEQGHTRYALQPDGTLLVTDWVWKDGGWQEFNRTHFVRESAAGSP